MPQPASTGEPTDNQFTRGIPVDAVECPVKGKGVAVLARLSEAEERSTEKYSQLVQ